MTEDNKIDVAIGKKIRQLRNMKGLSQSALAKECDITFQQVQKYEKGVNRVSAARLFDFARILGVEVAYFFKDAGANENKKYSFSDKESAAFEKEDVLTSKETLTLVREYYKIKESSARKNILELIKAMNSK